MSAIDVCKSFNDQPGVTPYIKYWGDEYFKKGWFGYKPIKGPDGTMSSGAMINGPHFKTKRGDIFVRRGADIIPGWGTIAGNLTFTNDFEADIRLIMEQDEVHGIFWLDDSTNEVLCYCWNDE